MSIDDESHREPSPPTPSRVGGDPAAPRALSIDEEWAVIMALEEERGRAHAAEPTPVASPAPTHEDLSYLEPIVYPGANDPVNPWRCNYAEGQRVALEVVALVGAAESGVSCGRYCRHCAALRTGSRPWCPQVSDHAIPVSGDSVVELLDPCPLRRVRQTHESVRRLSYWCSDRSFRGVLGNSLRLRVDVRDSRECRRTARFVT